MLNIFIKGESVQIMPTHTNEPMLNLYHYSGQYYYNHFMALWILSRTTWVSRHQKGKSSLDLLQQETVSGSGMSWAMCKSAPRPDT